jgi:prevent-host-death family protein
MITAQRTVTAADANRLFSEVLRDVRNGTRVVVTVHGKAVAQIVGIDERIAAADDARQTLLARLAAPRPARATKWTRESLYAEESRTLRWTPTSWPTPKDSTMQRASGRR